MANCCSALELPPAPDGRRKQVTVVALDTGDRGAIAMTAPLAACDGGVCPQRGAAGPQSMNRGTMVDDP